MAGGASPLLTDLYELNMLEAYLDGGETGTAVFELFFRKFAPQRNFLVAAGLEQTLEYLAQLNFGPPELDWLARSGRFSRRLIDYLAGFRFTGDVHAVPEGTLVFADEPIIRVTAPLPEAQIVETRLINLLHFQTVIASKAARMVLAAPGKTLVDFGLRRAHGAEAGLLAARAAYIAGFAGTATLQAGVEFGIPVHGTMAHSFVQAHDDEAAAFERFARSRPENLTLLIDTYDCERAAQKVVDLAPRLASSGIRVQAVRLDSGDLGALAHRVRAILDAGGLSSVRIFASGGLDEWRLADLAATAPIDGFGVGTSLTVSADQPALDCAYKLQEYRGIARRKWSTGKVTWPGRKQIFRTYRADGAMAGDLLTVEGDPQAGAPLLIPVMRGGKRLGERPSLASLREHAAAELARLPQPWRNLDPALPYPVTVTPALTRLAAEVDRRIEAGGRLAR